MLFAGARGLVGGLSIFLALPSHQGLSIAMLRWKVASELGLWVARGGVEPPTFRFSVGRSYQLSYLAGIGSCYICEVCEPTGFARSVHQRRTETRGAGGPDGT